jgi:hypothetical protein
MDKRRIAELLRELAMLIEADDAGPARPAARVGTTRDAEDAIYQTRVQKAQSDLASAIQEVYEHWRQATGKARARLSPDRAQKIRARLASDGFSVADLKRAVDGALSSPYHCGENETGTTYLDIRTIFRNCEVVEGHIERIGRLPDSATPEPVTGEAAEWLRELEDAARAAKQAGDVEEYNRLNREAKALMGRKPRR